MMNRMTLANNVYPVHPVKNDRRWLCRKELQNEPVPFCFR